MEYITETLLSLYTQIVGLIANISPSITIAVACVFLVLAFLSYKLYKVVLVLGGAGIGYFVGSSILPLFLNLENPNMICGIICAVVFGILAIALHKVMIFISGASLGYVLCSTISTLMFASNGALAENSNMILIISIVGAVVVGILFVALFKPLYIIITAFGCAISAASILLSLVMAGQESYTIVCYVVGGVIGLLATIVQFKTNRKREPVEKKSK